jgi:hypothetical protein
MEILTEIDSRSKLGQLPDFRKKNKSKVPTPRSIEEFCALYDLDGYLLDNYPLSQNKNNSSFRISTPDSYDQALEITKVYDEIYNGSYPYKEMLDPDYVYKSFSDPNYFWAVFSVDGENSSENITETGDRKCDVAGCFTIVGDKEHNTGYSRGLNVRPRYQGKIQARRLACALIRRYLDTNPTIDKWYGEGRTAHSISQFLATTYGAQVTAIFPHKDYFHHKKESDVLLVAYSHKTLYEKRITPARILREVYPFYENFIAEYPDLKFRDERNMVFSPRGKTLQVNHVKIARVIRNAKIFENRDKYGYVHFTFQDLKSGSYMSGLYTPQVKNIEKLKFKCANSSIFAAFYYLLCDFVDQNKIEYVEFHIAASDIVCQKFLLQEGLLITGYIPAWLPNAANKLEDAVVIVKTNSFPTAQEIKLVDPAQRLFNSIGLINRTSNQKFSRKKKPMNQILNVYLATTQ